jgi:hypothetical protein
MCELLVLASAKSGTGQNITIINFLRGRSNETGLLAVIVSSFSVKLRFLACLDNEVESRLFPARHA